MADNSNIDANIVIEIALNKVIELQKQVILMESKYITLQQDYKKVQMEYQVLKSKSEESEKWDAPSTTTRKTTTK